MLVKLIDETLNVANMPDEEALVKGYKIAVFSEKPTAEEGYHAVSQWEETADSYVQSWTVVEDVDDGIIGIDEALNILMGEES